MCGLQKGMPKRSHLLSPRTSELEVKKAEVIEYTYIEDISTCTNLAKFMKSHFGKLHRLISPGISK